MWVGLGILAGCSGSKPQAPVVTPEVASEHVTFGTLEDIGSFVFQSSTSDTRVSAGRSTVRESTLSLKWKDRDHWEYEATNDGKPTTHWLIFDAKAFEGLSGQALIPRGDPEPFRAQLSLGWDSWEDIVAITDGRIVYGPGSAETVEGRAAIRHDVSLAPPIKGAKKAPKRATGEALVPVSLTGTVWIDKDTSVRVLADVTATAASPVPPITAPDGTEAPSATPPDRTRTLAIKLAVTGLRQDPGVAAPTATPKAASATAPAHP